MKSFHFGTNLRQIRLSQELSQEYIAQRLGVSQPTYSRWEQDAEPTMQLEQLESLAQCLQVSKAHLTGAIDIKPYRRGIQNAEPAWLSDWRFHSTKLPPYMRIIFIAAILFIAFAVYEFMRGFFSVFI